jgi:ActR/RegA family two-component response regulator
MKISEPAVPAVLEQVEGVASRQGKAETGALQCLVASASQTRRNLLSKAASTAGWATVLCTDPHQALAEFRRVVFQFAVIDLNHHGRTPRGFRELLQALAEDSSRILLGVCGHEADPEEEVWVRQLGIWLYLPGATNSSEIALLCEHAKTVVDKQRGVQEVPTARCDR